MAAEGPVEDAVKGFGEMLGIVKMEALLL
jgi:hypothetical protein